MWRFYDIDWDQPEEVSGLLDLVNLVTQTVELLGHILAHSEGALLYKGFQMSTDILVLFNERLAVTRLHPLAYIVPASFKQLFINSFTSLIDDTLAAEGDENQKRYLDTLLSCAAKLASYDYEEFKELAAVLLQKYRTIKDSTCEDLIKFTTANLKKLGYPHLLEAQCNALIKTWEDSRDEDKLHELARRLAMSHMPTAAAARSFLPLLRTAVNYALEEEVPVRFRFLSWAITPFLSRATAADLNKITQMLEVASTRLASDRERQESNEQDAADWALFDEFKEHVAHATEGAKKRKPGKRKAPGSDSKEPVSEVKEVVSALEDSERKGADSDDDSVRARGASPAASPRGRLRLEDISMDSPSRSRSRSRSRSPTLVARGKPVRSRSRSRSVERSVSPALSPSPASPASPAVSSRVTSSRGKRKAPSVSTIEEEEDREEKGREDDKSELGSASQQSVELPTLSQFRPSASANRKSNEDQKEERPSKIRRTSRTASLRGSTRAPEPTMEEIEEFDEPVSGTSSLAPASGDVIESDDDDVTKQLPRRTRRS
eukprot:TRINITY_DN5103_c0_g2_i3.p1 TRINITY_DN5103_c0_g2~~TRINITY_DN5103_c0_g2_i3.p1  ORF type:complete len:548 (-),score=132.46 TRINITY_DN5103_c0_g2_i3:160-1803(-)